jgi:hypothetical protein
MVEDLQTLVRHADFIEIWKGKQAAYQGGFTEERRIVFTAEVASGSADMVE